MKYLYLIIISIISQIAYSQFDSRMMLHGQVKCDSVNIANVVVFNVNSRTGIIVKNEGLFEINAKVRDTLVFSSLNFFTKKIVLVADDFQENPLIVKLLLKINNLDEVKVVNNNQKYNLIPADTQRIVDGLYSDDGKSHLKNANVYDGQTPGINFVRLFKDVVKLFKKNNPKKTDYFAGVDFTELVLKKVKYTYFINTLNLKDEEIRLFLVFCENDPAAQNLSRYKTAFELMDFLFNKNKEFSEVKAKVK